LALDRIPVERLAEDLGDLRRYVKKMQRSFLTREEGELHALRPRQGFAGRSAHPPASTVRAVPAEVLGRTLRLTYFGGGGGGAPVFGTQVDLPAPVIEKGCRPGRSDGARLRVVCGVHVGAAELGLALPCDACARLQRNSRARREREVSSMISAVETPYRNASPSAWPAPHCLYCGRARAAIGDVCPGCGAEPPSVPCRSCGRAVPAPLANCICGATCSAWADTLADGLSCPRCHQGTLSRVALDVSSIHVEQCSRCLGCFIRSADFSEFLTREEHGEAVGLQCFVPLAPGRELPRQTLLAPVRCAHCPRIMDRVRFADRVSLLVDVCAAHGIWLDAGEVVGLLNFVRERDANGSVPPGPSERAEEEMWDHINVLRAREAAEVNLHTTNAEVMTYLPTTMGAAALGGPWVGFFVALRNCTRRR
jgi:Zn-finger nucleic acid-binding protein